MPITTFHFLFRAAKVVNLTDQGPNRKLDQLNIRVGDPQRIEEALSQVRQALLLSHRGIEDFGFDTRETWWDYAERAGRAARVSGGLIAGISLLIGGLGITNIMLASIAERVREIGIRRALGARGSDVFFQILVESVLLAALGGIGGLATAWFVIAGLTAISPEQNNPIIEMSAVLISFAFAVGVGVLAGIYPAYRAAKLSPMEALRYE